MSNSTAVQGRNSGYPFISLVDPENPVDPRYPAPSSWRSILLSVSSKGWPVINGPQEAIAACVTWEKNETLRILLDNYDSQLDQQVVIFLGSR